jgi:hypothetical protein
LKVFKPNLTSALLIEATVPIAQDHHRLLDLGSGNGNVGLEIAKKCGLNRIFSSDLDDATGQVVAEQSINYGIEVDHRIGSLFEPWCSEKFDLIIDDVSGVAEEIAIISPWFNGVPCASGESGTRLVAEVLAQSKDYLLPEGQIIFPIISLSNREDLLQVAGKHFRDVRLLRRSDWPLPPSMMPHLDLMRKLKKLGYANFTEKFGMIICYTEIYIGSGFVAACG